MQIAQLTSLFCASWSTFKQERPPHTFYRDSELGSRSPDNNHYTLQNRLNVPTSKPPHPHYHQSSTKLELTKRNISVIKEPNENVFGILMDTSKECNEGLSLANLDIPMSCLIAFQVAIKILRETNETDNKLTYDNRDRTGVYLRLTLNLKLIEIHLESYFSISAKMILVSKQNVEEQRFSPCLTEKTVEVQLPKEEKKLLWKASLTQLSRRPDTPFREIFFWDLDFINSGVPNDSGLFHSRSSTGTTFLYWNFDFCPWRSNPKINKKGNFFVLNGAYYGRSAYDLSGKATLEKFNSRGYKEAEYNGSISPKKWFTPTSSKTTSSLNDTINCTHINPPPMKIRWNGVRNDMLRLGLNSSCRSDSLQLDTFPDTFILTRSVTNGRIEFIYPQPTGPTLPLSPSATSLTYFLNYSVLPKEILFSLPYDKYLSIRIYINENHQVTILVKDEKEMQLTHNSTENLALRLVRNLLLNNVTKLNSQQIIDLVFKEIQLIENVSPHLLYVLIVGSIFLSSPIFCYFLLVYNHNHKYAPVKTA